jgi:hypothetical protein
LFDVRGRENRFLVGSFARLPILAIVPQSYSSTRPRPRFLSLPAKSRNGRGQSDKFRDGNRILFKASDVNIDAPRYSRAKIPNETGPISKEPSRNAAPCTSNGCKELTTIIFPNGALQACAAGLMATMIRSAPADRR